jgi:hypothetical protein
MKERVKLKMEKLENVTAKWTITNIYGFHAIDNGLTDRLF